MLSPHNIGSMESYETSKILTSFCIYIKEFAKNQDMLSFKVVSKVFFLT
jgi:hypothetical protein